MNAIPEYNSKWKWMIIGLVLAFLYIPILLLMIYSFNESRLVTVWSGFSTKWYGELLRDELLMKGFKTSLIIGVFSASAAVVLGTISAFIMQRFTSFRGETGFAFMITAPLVMPDVITGLSLLLLFISLGQFFDLFAQRGMLTIWIAHVTFCTAYVTVVVSSRLQELDNSIEEAAQDLGAAPVKVFFLITLPMIAPALVAGWLLAFTLSLDDLVISSFVSGPSSTTLPIAVFSSVRLGLSPKINALATIMVLIVSFAAFLGWWLMSRADKRRRQEIRASIT
ncbi:ABC transporter permease subunit [Reinekea marinisedimentorum]|uniref:Putrescine transport system permease protein n=1 Tax=Reinekea marinisedimentorum TaxID=230495 RepID=A0A4R3I456_9GAMM|nr:ABC transporter permease subunit [Reinekea marinisedimentorum]TCS40656.1 putrescine transport system permease protein [Reinekea marinisedimentorum]